MLITSFGIVESQLSFETVMYYNGTWNDSCVDGSTIMYLPDSASDEQRVIALSEFSKFQEARHQDFYRSVEDKLDGIASLLETISASSLEIKTLCERVTDYCEGNQGNFTDIISKVDHIPDLYQLTQCVDRDITTLSGIVNQEQGTLNALGSKVEGIRDLDIQVKELKDSLTKGFDEVSKKHKDLESTSLTGNKNVEECLKKLETFSESLIAFDSALKHSNTELSSIDKTVSNQTSLFNEKVSMIGKELEFIHTTIYNSYIDFAAEASSVTQQKIALTESVMSLAEAMSQCEKLEQALSRSNAEISNFSNYLALISNLNATISKNCEMIINTIPNVVAFAERFERIEDHCAKSSNTATVAAICAAVSPLATALAKPKEKTGRFS